MGLADSGQKFSPPIGSRSLLLATSAGLRENPLNRKAAINDQLL